MYKNDRPTANGKMLNNYNNGMTPRNLYICNDYLIKHSGELRDNAYCIDPQRLHELNILGKDIYRFKGNRDGVYYSGNYQSHEMFYGTQYKEFKKDILASVLEYDTYIKIDLKNFYKTISLKKLKKKFMFNKSIYLFIDCIENLGIAEYPIIQDCLALSYFATTIVLDEMDKQLKGYINSWTYDNKFIRYCDDLYIFFNENIPNIHEEVKKIVLNSHFEINEEKYEHRSTKYISENLAMQGYSVVVHGDELDYDYLVDEEVEQGLFTFFTKLYTINSQLEYNALINEAFSIEKDTVKKKFLNEIIFSSKYDDLVNNYISKYVDNLLKQVCYDPITVVKLIVKSKGDSIKRLLSRLYWKLENGFHVETTIIALVTYVTTRNVTSETKNKIIAKIKLRDPNFAIFLAKYVLL